MRVVVRSLDKKQLHDVHLLCSDICIPTGSTVTRPGWHSLPEVCVSAKSTANSSVEEASLPSDVLEHFYIITCNHLPTMLYNVVHV